MKRVKIGNSTVEYDSFEDHLEIYSLRTPQKYRRQGEAARAMKYMCDLADGERKSIRLLASPLDKKTVSWKLIRFYEKFGFKPTGQRGNFAGDPWMERKRVEAGIKVKKSTAIQIANVLGRHNPTLAASFRQEVLGEVDRRDAEQSINKLREFQQGLSQFAGTELETLIGGLKPSFQEGNFETVWIDTLGKIDVALRGFRQKLETV